MAEFERSSRPQSPERRTTSPEVYLFADRMLAHQPELMDAAQAGIREACEASASRSDADIQFISAPDITQHISNIGLEERVNARQADVVRFANRMLGIADGTRDVFVVTSQDLTAPNANFVFGMTTKEHRISVQSLNRFMLDRSVQTEELVEATSLVARHEMAHMIGLDDDTIVNQDTRGGLYLGHCTNVCTMRQVMSVQDAIQLNRELAECEDPFCSNCRSALAQL